MSAPNARPAHRAGHVALERHEHDGGAGDRQGREGDAVRDAEVLEVDGAHRDQRGAEHEQRERTVVVP